jgi:hypothetical protein
MTAVMAACSSDSIETDQPNQNGREDLTLRISTGATTRARTTNWKDTNAQDEEMMNLWVVVVTNTVDGEVQKFIACRPADGSEREIDEVGRVRRGDYTIYSFANISVSNVCTLLGLTAPTTISSLGATPVELTVRGTVSHANVAAATTTVNGNGFDPTAANNGFGETGIPMSNVQTVSITDNSKDLIVVRMLAKFEVWLYNEGANDVVVKSISLTDVTANAANNLKLLPNYGTTPNYPDDMDAHHKDIQPNLGLNNNLGTGTTRDNLTVTLPGSAAQRTVAHGNTAPVKFSFYVNESVAPDNGSGLFYLSFGFEGQKEYHHALINQKGSTTDDDDAWHYIARNDYRIIPVHLTDWLFRVEPIALAPIAGYPAKTLSSDALKATFNTGGMIALQPFVKKKSDTSWRDFEDVEVTYGEVVKDANDNTKDDEEKSWNASISWKNNNGVKQAGNGMILTMPFTYDPNTKCIIGELNNSLSAGTYTTAVTIKLKVGPSGSQYNYSFTFDVILQK